MNKLKEPFYITVVDADSNKPLKLEVKHETETFDFELNGQRISIINNGDNSWSTVSGVLSQEIVNFIGDEIERHYKNISM